MSEVPAAIPLSRDALGIYGVNQDTERSDALCIGKEKKTHCSGAAWEL